MKRFTRSDRVSGLVGRELSVIIDRELRDKRIGMVTVTGVDMSRDLKNARVYVSVLGGEEETNRSIEALNAASAFIRTRLGERVVLRYLPNLLFLFDSSTVDGMRMDRILDSIVKDDSELM
ncbi:MAG: 30S ribosome-binding factor RbfA [Candidatus Latescibacteria bacterium]|nr:30S ribosome-binding factor RbfA [Candidatus Latescibacterota bacterium]